MDQMDEDLNDAAWHQAESDERRRLEDEMLAQDPGYREFLVRYEASKSGN